MKFGPEMRLRNLVRLLAAGLTVAISGAAVAFLVVDLRPDEERPPAVLAASIPARPEAAIRYQFIEHGQLTVGGVVSGLSADVRLWTGVRDSEGRYFWLAPAVVSESGFWMSKARVPATITLNRLDWQIVVLAVTGLADEKFEDYFIEADLGEQPRALYSIWGAQQVAAGAFIEVPSPAPQPSPAVRPTQVPFEP